MRHIISLLLENEPGARYATGNDVDWYLEMGFQAFKLACPYGPADGLGGLRKNEEFVAQARELIGPERELMLVKVRATGAQRAEIKRTTDIFRGQIVDVTSSVYTIQMAGTSEKLDSFLQAIGTAAILETVRSGVTGIARGDKVLSI